MIRFFIGLVLVIAACGMIEFPNSDWGMFTILTAVGMPCMMWGVLAMSGRE